MREPIASATLLKESEGIGQLKSSLRDERLATFVKLLQIIAMLVAFVLVLVRFDYKMMTISVY